MILRHQEELLSQRVAQHFLAPGKNSEQLLEDLENSDTVIEDGLVLLRAALERTPDSRLAEIFADCLTT